MEKKYTEEVLQEEKQGAREKTGSGILIYRWLFLLLVIISFFTHGENLTYRFAFLQTVAIGFVYNVMISYYVVKSGSKGRGKIPLAFYYVDVLLLAFFSYQSGGVDSEMYLLYFFIVGICGIYGNISGTIKISIFIILAYTLSCILQAAVSIDGMNLWKLVLRDFLILCEAHGVTIINNKVKKYDELHKKEFKLARTDKLTGLANRHYFDQKLKEELWYAENSGKPLNVLIFDLDNFKRFNDTYGHVSGDKLLSLFSDIVMQNIRRSDIPVRYGGEEFLILIRDLEIDMAKSVGDRIRRQLEKQRIYVGNEDSKRRVTVSCGVAQYPKHSSNVKEVIDLADKALYHAKEIGKNIVVTYDEIGKTGQGVQVDIESYMGR